MSSGVVAIPAGTETGPCLYEPVEAVSKALDKHQAETGLDIPIHVDGASGGFLAPFIDRNPSNKPETRKFAISLFTIFVMFWAVLVIIGSFFRGPGFNFVFPWKDGIFFEL